VRPMFHTKMSINTTSDLGKIRDDVSAIYRFRVLRTARLSTQYAVRSGSTISIDDDGSSAESSGQAIPCKS
jgi:hypothetical protein